MAKRAKKPLEAVNGRYFALPHAVLDSEAWIACSPHAKALLLELCRQHTGSNNGRLHLSRAWLALKGWSRPATVNKLRDELVRLRLILQTRHGGLNNGAHWFALTRLQVTNFTDLNIAPRDYHPGLYLLAPLPTSEKEKKGCTAYVRAKPATRTPYVRDEEGARTPSVREKALFDDSARTPYVHNEYNQYPAPENADPWMAGYDEVAHASNTPGLCHEHHQLKSEQERLSERARNDGQ
jgi:hypothetical protein